VLDVFRWADRFRQSNRSSAPKTPNALSFVLTLALGGTGRSGNDLARAAILLDSMVKHVSREEIAELLVITRPQDVDEVRRQLETYTERLRLSVVDESDLCPGLSANPQTLNMWPEPNLGWYRQQILKLASCELVRSPFYMTLDSDVIFTKPFHARELLRGGKSLVGTERRADYERLYEESFAASEAGLREYRDSVAERLLKLKRRYTESWYSETPVILSAALASKLVAHLDATWGQPWRQSLVDNLDWTEYSLYFTYAEATGLLEQFHEVGDCDAVMNFSRSLWWGPDAYRDRRTVDAWAVDQAFSPASRGCCVVVQSYVGYDPADIRRRIDQFVPPASGQMHDATPKAGLSPST
jgi:Family of unknown function (DUF6492)